MLNFPGQLVRWLKGGGEPSRVRRLHPSHSPLQTITETHQRAARSLVDRDAINTHDYLAKIVKAPRQGTHPDLVTFYMRFNAELRLRGYPFYAFEFLRDHARQKRLFDMGNSRARPGQSAHNFGLAVDVVHTQRFWDLTKEEWAIIGAIGKEAARKCNVKIAWGGDFKSLYDPAHWEIAHWRDLAELMKLHPQDDPGDDDMYFRHIDALLAAR